MKFIEIISEGEWNIYREINLELTVSLSVENKKQMCNCNSMKNNKVIKINKIIYTVKKRPDMRISEFVMIPNI